METIPFYLIFLGISLLLALIFSRTATRFKSPLIVGYIVAGAVLGPSVTNFISFERIESLEIINLITLSLIGFGIGGALQWKQIRKLGKVIISILFFEAFGAFFFVSLIVSLVMKSIPLGLIFGSLAIATAPAATVEVIRQYKAKGKLTTTLYAVVGLDDILALLIFIFTLPIAMIFLGDSATAEISSLLSALGAAGLEIILSAIIGILAGFVLMFFVKRIHKRTVLLLFTIGIIFLNCGMAEQFELSPILLNMVMGIFAINSSAINAKKIFNALGDWSPPIYVWFFVLVGARLDIPILIKFFGISLIYILARSIGKWVGCFIGGHVSRADSNLKKYLGFCLGDQAGVAVGLALVASSELAQAGLIHYSQMIISTITATTFIVMLIGPLFLRWALFKSGNAKVKE